MNEDAFTDISILIVDGDRKFQFLLMDILETFGFKDMESVSTGDEALEKITKKYFDLIITEWDVLPMGGIELTKRVRTDKGMPDPMVPIIMISSRADRLNIQEARDAGVNEFLAKPFSVSALRDRMISVIEEPREFVISKNFIGPSRRRRTAQPPGLMERRDRQRKNTDSLGVTVQSDGKTKIVRPSYRIKKKISSADTLDKLISLEKIKAAETLIEEGKGEFLSAALREVIKMDKIHYALVERIRAKPDSRDMRDLRAISDIALRVKGLAGIYGYTLASEVARMLSLLAVKKGLPRARSLEIINVHIHALEIIFQRNIKGKYGQLGRELIAELEGLLKKE